jgi:hypothetical protein
MKARAISPPIELVERAAVVSKAVVRAARLLNLNNAALARAIGLSEPTISRLRAGNFILELETKPYELALLLIRLFRSLDAVMGGDETSLKSWMTTQNLALRGVPQELVKTVPGLVAAADYVDAARARI